MKLEIAMERAQRAHERRWGKSMLPISATVHDGHTKPLVGVQYVGVTRFIRTIDHESGSACDWTFQFSRVTRIGERPPTK